MVPDIARKLVAQGHEVVLEPGAGEHAGIPDGLFEQAGATLGSDSVAIQLSYARLVVVVPGYGMAVAQAQRAVDRAGSRRRAQAHDGLVLRGHRQPALLRPEDDDAVR